MALLGLVILIALPGVLYPLEPRESRLPFDEANCRESSPRMASVVEASDGALTSSLAKRDGMVVTGRYYTHMREDGGVLRRRGEEGA